MTRRRVECHPSDDADLGLQRRLQRLVGIVGADEAGVADEEGLHVVVGVDEPTHNAFGAVAARV